MKKGLFILWLVIICCYRLHAQVATTVESFREKVLPLHAQHFTHADMTENGQLLLEATAKYAGLGGDAKNAVMTKVLPAWKDSVMVVHYGSVREIWGWSSASGNFLLLDAYDLNAARKVQTGVFQTRPYPIFIYIGGQIGGDTQKNINISLNARFGFYLLFERWDMAATLSAGRSGNIEYSSTGWANVGLMSRVHFPIKKIGLSPNIGAQLNYGVYGQTSSTFTGALMIGCSWFVGIGSLNIGFQFGNEVSGSIGYSMFPGMMKR
jgi:hypothetical protein